MGCGRGIIGRIIEAGQWWFVSLICLGLILGLAYGVQAARQHRREETQVISAT